MKLGSYSRLTDNNTSNSAVAELKAKAKGKGKAVEEDQPTVCNGVDNHENRLSTLDIFAGCGGLSEGLHQAGSSVIFSLLNKSMVVQYISPCHKGDHKFLNLQSLYKTLRTTNCYTHWNSSITCNRLLL